MLQAVNTTLARVSFRRRLGALLYDSIAAFTVLYFAAFIPVLSAGTALTEQNPLFTLYLIAVLFCYFWASWSRGSTLGMQAWKIEIRTIDGRNPGLRECVLRFLFAGLSGVCFGLGYAVALLDQERRAWHDRMSGTLLVRKGTSADADS